MPVRAERAFQIVHAAAQCGVRINWLVDHEVRGQQAAKAWQLVTSSGRKARLRPARLSFYASLLIAGD